MAKIITPFSIGQRWYCDRSKTKQGNKHGWGNFTFVIIGVSGKCEKRCRLEYDDSTDPLHNSEDVFSHKHLKEHATLISEVSPESKLWIGQSNEILSSVYIVRARTLEDAKEILKKKRRQVVSWFVAPVEDVACGFARKLR